LNGSPLVALFIKYIKAYIKLKTFSAGLNNKNHIQILKYVKECYSTRVFIHEKLF
jgi:hypothetical protein